MAHSELEVPADPQALYYAVGEDLPTVRPYLTGDVFSGVALPGFGEKLRDVAVLTHPCSMRADGVTLTTRLLVAEVRREEADWRGQYDRMPLPDPHALGDDRSIWFANASSVKAADLRPENRWLALTHMGLNLLQQQLVYYLTRVVVESHVLHAASAHVYEEVDLLEEWLELASEADASPDVARADFHEWLREDVGGLSRQQALQDEQRRSQIRREARAEARSRYGP